MSSVDGDELSRLNYKDDNLNVPCVSRTGFIRWINSSEFLLIFDSYCLVYRLEPYSKMTSQADLFPLSMTRVSIDSRMSQIVLNCCLNVLKHFGDIDANYARACAEVSSWSTINEALSDPIFLQQPVSNPDYAGQSSEGVSVMITNVTVEGTENSAELQPPTGRMIIMASNDGRAHAALKLGHEKYDVAGLTSILCDYVTENVDVLRTILPEAAVLPATSQIPVMLDGLKNISLLGRFLSTIYWFPTILRYEDNLKEACGISLQRSGHFIRWKYTLEPGWRSFRVVGVSKTTITDVVTSAIPFQNGTICSLLLGTIKGDVLLYPVGLSSDEEGFRLISKHDGGFLRVTVMRLFPLENGRYLLLVGRHVFITAVTLSTASGTVAVVSSMTTRTPSRFPITDIVHSGDAFYTISNDKVTKYEIRVDEDAQMRSLDESVITLKGEKVAGFTFSTNGVLKMEAVMRRSYDYCYCPTPLSVRFRSTSDPEELWFSLMRRGDLKDATDCLMLLRYFILNRDTWKVIVQLLAWEMRILDSAVDTVDLCKLKVLRFAVTVLCGKRMKPDDLESWNGERVRIERLLMIRACLGIAQRAVSLDRVRRANTSVRQVLTSVSGILSKEGIDVPFDAAEMERSRCPLCDCESSQSASTSEHICTNNHHFPACALSFIPIPSFSYRKCSRCDLPVLDRETSANLIPLIEDIDSCHFCDGDIVTL